MRDPPVESEQNDQSDENAGGLVQIDVNRSRRCAALDAFEVPAKEDLRKQEHDQQPVQDDGGARVSVRKAVHGCTVSQTGLIVAVALVAALAGCVTVPNRPSRLDRSTSGCMAAVVRDKVPKTLPDKQTHCLASGLIARYCSPPEAYLAGMGKEMRDLLGPGDFEWADWRADRAGVRCARYSTDDTSLATCCSIN